MFEILLALVAAVFVGVAGGWLLARASQRGWTSGMATQLAILGLALVAYFTSVAIGGNGFIAAFAGGIMSAPPAGANSSSPPSLPKPLAHSSRC